MTHPKLKEILERIKNELRLRYGKRLAEVRLFGSQVRGDANEDSDIDLLVVLRDKEVHISGSRICSFLSNTIWKQNTAF
ncbi:MAG: nucleotidyltransferase domain-containing protein [Saprospirales bacterium]|nr:nucleotidyltransferase domain-containing protein [Saprospirales bacterium]